MTCACNVFGLCVWHFGHLDRREKEAYAAEHGFRTGKTSVTITRKNER